VRDGREAMRSRLRRVRRRCLTLRRARVAERCSSKDAGAGTESGRRRDGGRVRSVGKGATRNGGARPVGDESPSPRSMLSVRARPRPTMSRAVRQDRPARGVIVGRLRASSGTRAGTAAEASGEPHGDTLPLAAHRRNWPRSSVGAPLRPSRPASRAICGEVTQLVDPLQAKRTQGHDRQCQLLLVAQRGTPAPTCGSAGDRR
jgi:hypothetical protein